MIEVYIYSSCSSCRRTVETLAASGVEFRVRDYIRDRFTADQLRNLLAGVGLTPAMALSTRSRVYRQRELDVEALSDNDILNLMVEEPTLLRRPIVIKGRHVVIGHKPEELALLLAS